MNFLSIVLGFLPGVAWLFFFLQEDKIHPEPKRLIVYAFVVGGLITIPTLATEFIFQDLITAFNVRSPVLPFLGLAILEEIFKFLSVYWTVRWSREFNEPIDAMIYMTTAALGFATVENIAVLGNFVGGPLAEFLQSGVSTASLRFIGATLLHALAGGLIGYYWALGILKNKVSAYLGLGLFLAILVHYVFNLLILRFENENLLYPSIFLVFVAFFILSDFEKLKGVVQ